MSLFVQQHHSYYDFSSNESWIILSAIEQSIKRKIEAVGTPLKDWDIKINYGIKTGFNDAFIISTAKREEILSNCIDEDERERTAAIIRPILRGRDIKRYGYSWADLWLINTHNGVKGAIPRIDVNDYPAIKQHLDSYWDSIAVRADKGDTPYNLRNCAYLEDFNKPKIIFQEIVQESSFALDNNIHYYCNDTGRIIVGPHLEHIIGVLNSKLFFFAVKHFYGGGILGEHGVRMKHTFFENFPCLGYDMAVANMATQLQQQYTDEVSKQLDNLLYDKYGLNDEEREYIEIGGF